MDLTRTMRRRHTSTLLRKQSSRLAMTELTESALSSRLGLSSVKNCLMRSSLDMRDWSTGSRLLHHSSSGRNLQRRLVLRGHRGVGRELAGGVHREHPRHLSRRQCHHPQGPGRLWLPGRGGDSCGAGRPWSWHQADILWLQAPGWSTERHQIKLLELLRHVKDPFKLFWVCDYTTNEIWTKNAPFRGQSQRKNFVFHELL